MRKAWMICRWLLEHATPAACSRALRRTGMRMEISSAMMPITTSSSTSVKAHAFPVRRCDMSISR
jgi:hypothetical protein